MEEVKYNSMTPLYQQVYDSLTNKIKAGAYARGEKIPSENELCEIYKVSRVTVRIALKKLKEDGLVVMKQGKGTFVAQPVYFESRFAKGSFTKSCELIGAVPATTVISASMKKGDDEVCSILGVPADSDIICIERLRMTDGTPAIFEVDYFSDRHSYVLEADTENVSMHETIRKYTGQSIEKYVDTYEVRFADKMQAKWLKCPVNTPLLGVSQVVYTQQEQVLYYNEQYIRSEIYKYISVQ